MLGLDSTDVTLPSVDGNIYRPAEQTLEEKVGSVVDEASIFANCVLLTVASGKSSVMATYNVARVKEDDFYLWANDLFGALDR